MSGGGGKTSTSTSKTEIPPEVLARYQVANDAASKAAATPYQSYSNDPNAFVAQINGQQQTGIAGTNTAAKTADPYYQAATGLTAAGAGQANLGALNTQQYLSPYLNNVLGATVAAENNQNAQQLSATKGNAIISGAFGGDRTGVAEANQEYQQNLANNQTNANILNTGYTNAQNVAQQQQGAQLSAQQANLARLSGAGQQLANIGTTAETTGLNAANQQFAQGTGEQQTSQAGLTALYNQFQQQQAYPFQTAQFLADIAEGTGSLSGSTTTSTQPSSFFSDRRLKTDIKKIGETDRGLPIYRFKYKGDDREQVHIGLMAQDVEKVKPEAVGESGGYKTVDYDLATRSKRYAGGLVPDNYAAGGALPYADSQGQSGYVPAAQQSQHHLLTGSDPAAKPQTGLQEAQQALQGGQTIAGLYNTGKGTLFGNAGTPTTNATEGLFGSAGTPSGPGYASSLFSKGAPTGLASAAAPAAETATNIGAPLSLAPAADAAGAGIGAAGTAGLDAAATAGTTAAAAGTDMASVLPFLFLKNGGIAREHHADGMAVDNGDVVPQSDDFGSMAVPPASVRNAPSGLVPASTAPSAKQDAILAQSKTLTPDQKGNLDPDATRNYIMGEVNRQGLSGYVPKDGAKYGIKTGAPDEWANLFTGLFSHESGLNTKNRGDVGQVRGASNGIGQLSPDDAVNWNLNGGKPFTQQQLEDPQTNINSAITISKKLLDKNGTIQGGMGQYYGPLSKEGWTPGQGRDASLPWDKWGASDAQKPLAQSSDGSPPARSTGLGPTADSLANAYQTPNAGPAVNSSQPSTDHGGVSGLLTNEKFWLPLLTGLGTMASSPSRYLGSAVLQGLGGGAKEYQDLEQQQAARGFQQQGLEQSQQGLGIQQQRVNIDNTAKQLSVLSQLRSIAGSYTAIGKPVPPEIGAQISSLTSSLTTSGAPTGLAGPAASVASPSAAASGLVPPASPVAQSSLPSPQSSASPPQSSVVGAISSEPHPQGGSLGANLVAQTQQAPPPSQQNASNKPPSKSEPMDDFHSKLNPDDDPLVLRQRAIATAGVDPTRSKELQEEALKQENLMQERGYGTGLHGERVPIPGWSDQKAASESTVKGAGTMVDAQQTAYNDAASRAQAAQRTEQIAKEMRDLMFDKNGKPLVNSGNMGPVINKYAGVLKQIGFSDGMIQTLSGTNPANAQALNKLRTSLATQTGSSDLPNGISNQKEYESFINSTPGDTLLPSAFKYILDNVVTPKVAQDKGAFKSIADMKPGKDNIVKALNEYREANPAYNPNNSLADRDQKTPQPAPAQAGWTPSPGMSVSPSTGRVFDAGGIEYDPKTGQAIGRIRKATP